MLRLFFCEMKKFYKFRVIKLILGTLAVLMMICGLTARSVNNMSVFDFQIFILKILGEFFIISFFVSFSAYIFGLEMDCKTLKVIRAKQVPVWKVYLVKFFTGVSYCALVLLIIYLISLLFGSMFLPIKGIKMDDLNLYYELAGESFLFVLDLYFKQFIASTFIVTFSLFVIILTQKKLLPVIFVPIVVMILNMVDNIKSFGYHIISMILPVNSDLLCRELRSGTVDQRLLSLSVYSIVFIISGIVCLKRKEVKV